MKDREEIGGGEIDIGSRRQVKVKDRQEIDGGVIDIC